MYLDVACQLVEANCALNTLLIYLTYLKLFQYF